MGKVDAQEKLSVCYGRGGSVAQNFEKAVQWTLKAAKQGNANAQLTVAGCYLQGKGVKQDIKKAFEWMEKSAEKGNREAQKNMVFLPRWSRREEG